MEKSVKWSNWSGSLEFTPGALVTPESEEEVVALVKKARKENKQVRVVGAGHSSTALVETTDYLLSLRHFKGVEAPDRDKHQATVLAGMTVKEAGLDLYRYGMAMHNTGDVDVQTLAGAIGTGTHGTGQKLPNLSAMLVGVRMVTGTGELLDTTIDKDPELFKALRVALGTCGVFLKMRLQLEPVYELHRKEWCVPIEKCLQDLESLKENNRNFDFYWYPRSDMAKIRVMNEVGQDMPAISYGRLDRENKGYSHEILPRTRELKFDEIEYALPAENGPACFKKVRDQIRKHFRREVAWRLLYRTIAADNTYISPMTGRKSVTISLHHNAGLPFEAYFKAIEPIFLEFGGRPHWGKKHYQQADKLQGLYPDWSRFHEIRQRLDPDGVFLTSYLRKLLLEDS